MYARGKIIRIYRNRKGEITSGIFLTESTQEDASTKLRVKGVLPDIVPGVHIWADIDDDGNIKKTKLLSNDVFYIKERLTKIKGISGKKADRIINECLKGEVKNYKKEEKKEEVLGLLKSNTKAAKETVKNTLAELAEIDDWICPYKKYGISCESVEKLRISYSDNWREKILKDTYTAFMLMGLDFVAADYLFKGLHGSFLDEKRIKGIIHTVLHENEDKGSTAIDEKTFYSNCEWIVKNSAWPRSPVSPYIILAVLSQLQTVYTEDGYFGYVKTANYEKSIAWNVRRLMDADTEISADFTKEEEKFNKCQREFLHLFKKNSLTLLLGRGGTGKTYTISGAIKLMKKEKPDAVIKLCAPTARAAGVLKEASGEMSSTIHVLLGLKPYGDELVGNEIQADMLVVDEMSMVDTELFCALLKSIKAGTKVILAGDPNQLESVGHGSVLRDLIEAQVIPSVELKQIMRQAAGSKIIKNCEKILEGDANLEADGKAFIIRRTITPEEMVMYLKSEYTPGLDNCQAISITKKGKAGTIAINKMFEKEESGLIAHGEKFCKDDKVVFTRNNYDDGYCNGDTGRVASVSKDELTVRTTDEKLVEVKEGNLADLTHAEVITVHKSQGSEYDNVFILLPDKPKSLLNRNIVNTAISRAKKTVHLVYLGDALKMAAANTYKSDRETRLVSMLKNFEKTEEKEDENSVSLEEIIEEERKNNEKKE